MAKSSAPLEQNLLIKKKSSNERTVRGRITSIEDGMPLPGVNVTIKGTTEGTISDVDGFYNIEMYEQDVLVYSFIGYTSEEVESGDTSELDISMYADVAQLSEVVVTAQGISRETEALGYSVATNDMDENENNQYARPKGGYYSYRKYLKEQLVYPQQALDSAIEGRVVLEFTVTSSGALKDFDIRKNLGYGCDEEAIRLIKEGPRWEVAEENGIPTDKTVRIKVKFELQ